MTIPLVPTHTRAREQRQRWWWSSLVGVVWGGCLPRGRRCEAKERKLAGQIPNQFPFSCFFFFFFFLLTALKLHFKLTALLFCGCCTLSYRIWSWHHQFSLLIGMLSNSYWDFFGYWPPFWFSQTLLELCHQLLK